VTQANGTVGKQTAKVGSKGTVSVAFAAKYSGSLKVTQPGGLRHAAASSAARAYSTPARITLTPSGHYSSKGGIKHYHKVSSIKINLGIQPARNLSATSKYQVYYGGKWQTASTITGTAAPSGSYLYLKSAPKHYRYRFVVSAAGDKYNSKPKTVTSPTFIID
jgi:hypothetical protein